MTHSDYKIAIDTHTHTFASGHAFSSLLENISEAKKKGMYGIVMTEHGPAMAGGAPDFTLGTYGSVPEIVEGIRVYRGTEANIINADGTVDIESRFLRKADFAMASMHDVVFRAMTKKLHTMAMTGAISNPYIDALAHPGNPYFEHDIGEVIATAKKYNKLIEINGHSFTYRVGSEPLCEEYIRRCRDEGIRISVGSDAHFMTGVGDFGLALKALADNGFPEELIVNRSKDSFEEYIAERRKRIEDYEAGNS